VLGRQLAWAGLCNGILVLFTRYSELVVESCTTFYIQGIFGVCWGNLLLVLVLVVDERGSFSAIDAHIFPCLVQTVLEDVD